jgi:hypothetical protein
MKYVSGVAEGLPRRLEADYFRYKEAASRPRTLANKKEIV